MGLFKKKDPIVEVEKALDHEVHEMEHDIQADVDAVMKKYDRESNTRIWEGAPKIALQVLMSAFSIYCILMTLFSKALPERRLSLFLGFIIIIGYLVYPARKGAARVNHVPWYDWILMVLGAGSFFYFAINAFLHHSVGHQASARPHHRRCHRYCGTDRAVPPVRGPAHSGGAGPAADLHVL